MKTPDNIPKGSALESLEESLSFSLLTFDDIILHPFHNDEELFQYLASPKTELSVFIYTDKFVLVSKDIFDNTLTHWLCIPRNPDHEELLKRSQTVHYSISPLTPTQTIAALEDIYDSIFTNGPAKNRLGGICVGNRYPDDGENPIYIEYEKFKYTPGEKDEDSIFNYTWDGEDGHAIEEKIYDIIFELEQKYTLSISLFGYQIAYLSSREDSITPLCYYRAYNPPIKT